MKILLVGSGGREHALALGLKADPSTTELHCAPGNPGIADLALLHPLDIKNNAAIVALAKELLIDLVVIGPEVPLVMAHQMLCDQQDSLSLVHQKLRRN